MMRITFHEKNVRRAEKSAACGQESIYAGCDDSGKIRYLLNDGSLYENRSCVLKDGVFQFDGYSTWFEEAGENRRPQGDFTLSLFLAPQEYSDEGDGLWCCLDRAERKGFGVLLHKHGRVAVCFGSGRSEKPGGQNQRPRFPPGVDRMNQPGGDLLPALPPGTAGS